MTKIEVWKKISRKFFSGVKISEIAWRRKTNKEAMNMYTTSKKKRIR